MRIRIVSAALAAVLALAPLTARADGDDAEARFHKAYETEVVDGKLADAARVYLALMDDAAAPARTRAEAKFRFAVTAVLLGRPDEARAHLDAIIADTTLPEALRTRARGYLDATKGVGVGTELDRKLQELVFELGRAPTYGPESSQPAVFRDFEVIGKPAVPFLRGLLAHPDGAIRMHAYRLLLRMDVPGLAEAWAPNLTTPSYPMVGSDLTGYLRKHADEAAAFERRMQDADAATLQALVASKVEVSVSGALLRSAKSKGADASTLTDLSWLSRDRDGVAHVLVEWLRDADRGVASGAAMNLAKMLNRGPIADLEKNSVLPALAAALVRSARTLNWNPTKWTSAPPSTSDISVTTFSGFMTVARACPVETLVTTLDEIVQSPAAETDDKIASVNRSYVADALAVAIDERPPEGQLRRGYADALCRWAESFSPGELRQGGDATPISAHLRTAVARLSRDDALAVIRRLWDTPARWSPHWFAYSALPRTTAQDWDLTMALLRLAEPKERWGVLAMSDNAQKTPEPVPLNAERASAILASLPEIARFSDADAPGGQSLPIASLFHACAPLVPVEAAREALVATVGALFDGADPREAGKRLNWLLNRGNEADKPFWRDVFLPVGDRIWPRLSGADRSGIVTNATTMLDLPGAAAFVVAHADAIPPGAAVVNLARASDKIPFEAWVPRAQPSVLDNNDISSNSRPDARAHALAKMAPDPAEASAAIRTFARRCSGAEGAARAFYDAILRTAPLDRMQEAILELDQQAWPASPEAREDALTRLLTVEKPVSFALRRLVEPLLQQRPSERLFPGVRRLLASPERGDVTSGIAAAQSLGSADLLPALADKLESMDAEVRQAAQAAIDSIVELGRRKEEARRRAAGGGGDEKR